MDINELKKQTELYDEIIRENRDDEFEEKQNKYFSDILPLYESEFIEKNSQSENYDVMFSLLGMSPATTVLTANAIKPEYLFIVGTKKSLKKCKKFLFSNIKYIKNENIEELEISESNLLENYETLMIKLKKIYDKKKIIIDITGGKKSMTSLAQIVSTNLNIDSCYVDSLIYDSLKRRPEFGTEFLEIFRNPLYITGEKYIKDAIKLFNKQRFTSALLELDKVKKSKKNYYYAELYASFIKAYSSWHCFDYEKALNNINYLLEEYEDELNAEIKGQLKSHIEILSKISEDKDLKRMTLNFYFSAERYASEGQFDVSVFLTYRAIEFILSEILLREFDFNPSEADFSKVGINYDDFKQEADKIYKKGYKWDNLPIDCGMMDNAIILSIKKHPVLKGVKLLDLKEKSTLRNNSIFTHGYSLLSEKEAVTLKKQLRTLICNMYPDLMEENIWDSIKKSYSFPNLNEDLL